MGEVGQEGLIRGFFKRAKDSRQEQPRIDEAKGGRKIEADSFEELYKKIEDLGSITGSKKTYAAEELKKIIEAVRKDDMGAEYITRQADLRGVVQKLLSKEFIASISPMMNKFKTRLANGDGEAYEGTVENFLWQHVRYGKELEKRGGELFRGYLMIEPTDFPTALEILSQMAEERLKIRKTTRFKWLLNPRLINLKEEDPRIVLYALDLEDIQEMLTILSQDHRWQRIESKRNKRYDGLASRRPGTNSFIDKDGKEWRSLNYNDRPGYSENEAADPNWRNYKEGTPTQRVA